MADKTVHEHSRFEQPDGVTYEHFRFEHADGATKDWAIAIAPPGLRIRYCATGRVARLSQVPWAKFAGNTAEQEMRDRIEKKLAKGYTKIGEAVIEDDRLVKPGPGSKLDMHWEVSVPLPLSPLLDALARISNQLSGVPNVSMEVLNQYEDASRGKNGKVVERIGLQVQLPRQTWNFGQQHGGGLNDDGRGGGRVAVNLGPVPFLILMALEREFPGKFHFADDDGNAVTLSIAGDDRFLGHAMDAPIDEIIDIGALLGLCLGPIRFTDSANESSDQTLWF